MREINRLPTFNFFIISSPPEGEKKKKNPIATALSGLGLKHDMMMEQLSSMVGIMKKGSSHIGGG
jgi:hypothetical protein